MGLPQINIFFKEAAETAIKRSGGGIVALILRDDTKLGKTAVTKQSYTYGKETEIDAAHFTETNVDYIKKTFLGSPKAVIVERIGADESVDGALGRLKNKKWNYLAMPSATADEAKQLSDWITAQRTAKKTFKAVLSHAADNEGVIDFETDGISTGLRIYTAAEYCCRIAGLLAGLSIDRYDRVSATYATLPEVNFIAESSDPDGDIDNGKLILINDGANIKIGRAVNSLKTLTNGKREDMKKIRIIETLDLIADDIRTAFEQNYVGVYANSYDNKLLFVNEVNQYYKRLENSGVLEAENDNAAYIDVDAQRLWLAERGDVSDLDDDTIKKAKTGSHVFVASNIMPLDAMEDLDMSISM